MVFVMIFYLELSKIEADKVSKNFKVLKVLVVFDGKIGIDIFIRDVVKLVFKKILVETFPNRKIFVNSHYDVLDPNILLINLYSNIKLTFKEVNLDVNYEITFLLIHIEIVVENHFKALDLLDRPILELYEV